MNTEDKYNKHLKQAREAIAQANAIISSEPDEAGRMQQLRSAASQAQQAANDLNILIGIVYASAQ